MTDAPGNARDSKPLCRYLTPSEKLGLIGPQLGATTAAAYNERLTNTSIMELRKRKIPAVTRKRFDHISSTRGSQKIKKAIIDTNVWRLV